MAGDFITNIVSKPRTRLTLLICIIFATLIWLISPKANHDADFGSSTSSQWIPTAASPKNLWTWASTSLTQTGDTTHPIALLMQDAQSKFRTLMSRQSTSLDEAVREYKKRYARSPPKGFEDWYKFAKENNVKIIDEYDSLVKDLEPFWALSGEELRRRALQVSCGFVFDYVTLLTRLTWCLGRLAALYRSCEGTKWRCYHS